MAQAEVEKSEVVPPGGLASADAATPKSAAGEPFFLSAATAIEKGRKAFLAGKLSAQGPTPACEYRDKSGLPCVIGAALPARLARKLCDAPEQNIRNIVQCGLIATDDVGVLIALQSAHDLWANPYVGPTTSANARLDLMALLGIDAETAQ